MQIYLHGIFPVLLRTAGGSVNQGLRGCAGVVSFCATNYWSPQALILRWTVGGGSRMWTNCNSRMISASLCRLSQPKVQTIIIVSTVPEPAFCTLSARLSRKYKSLTKSQRFQRSLFVLWRSLPCCTRRIRGDCQCTRPSKSEFAYQKHLDERISYVLQYE